MGFYLLLQNQELRPCNFTFYKKETETKEQSLYEEGVWVVSTTCIPLLVCSIIKHQPSSFLGASSIGSKQRGEMELFQLQF